ncbi:helix-turn-helix domain-containing protein [Porphyromonas sp. COT-052 OH4946]|uniref:helix-turn-helix domain-containing protein n=1 Tax=Porphyromonas sp. COT-052 OH4946 TaxID=1515618 RepID=UPI0009DEE9F9|nr:helix-turn-helix domain-containing protein [Porphyromonas sp. COT-052 OH4946]
MHKQLTSEQRYTIACLLKENVSIRKIAAMIGVAPRNEGDSKKCVSKYNTKLIEDPEKG